MKHENIHTMIELLIRAFAILTAYLAGAATVLVALSIAIWLTSCQVSPTQTRDPEEKPPGKPGDITGAWVLDRPPEGLEHYSMTVKGNGTVSITTGGQGVLVELSAKWSYAHGKFDVFSVSACYLNGELPCPPILLEPWGMDVLYLGEREMETRLWDDNHYTWKRR